jgi:hypothetical protein
MDEEEWMGDMGDDEKRGKNELQNRNQAQEREKEILDSFAGW